ncbi:imidazole glycerol phosphate synthase subunit HisH [Methanobacterium alcaliphilum]|uniref:imidazole glycerol phosphate synthase subunit HisH n=1 Tax=Methanobacterium alcaliphilum TaxID=392018 RepID=UPI00200A8C41|nr:imidazole glycerol phosphate synthase subunit HisH [Methanobacterium alcaliphilum]MCK9152315.1 imidazole glycerol phosphate synthase subunit HisH [Methanobacterium alcaliphilum]
MITIINYGSGNLKSICNGFLKIGIPAEVTNDPAVIEDADALVLPGVGAFGSAMNHLEKYRTSISKFLQQEKPFLGVCLGLQLLLSKSEESPGVNGLDIIQGNIIRLPPGLKIPHMGWNKLELKNECPILDGVDQEYMYFVHSYYARPDDEDVVAATTQYGMDVPAVLWKDNIFATQFHPEKSGEVGLKILKNFVKLLD